MVDVQEGFEQVDVVGSSSHYNGTVGTSSINIPTVSNKVISEFSIANVDADKSSILSVSLDGGSTFKTIGFNGSWVWSPKGKLRQIKIKGDAASRAYEIVMNFEEY